MFLHDNDLAQKAAQGDKEALCALLARHGSYVYRIAYKIVLNKEDAEDITQEVFLRVTTAMERFDPNGNFRSWLATISARQAISYRRKLFRRRERLLSPEALARMTDSEGLNDGRSIVDALQTESLRRLIEGAMTALSIQQRAIFALYLAEDMKPGEIARTLDIPAKQVSGQLRRAITKIREAVEGQKR